MPTQDGSRTNFLGSAISETTFGTDPSAGSWPSSWQAFRKLEIMPKYDEEVEERATYHNTAEPITPIPSRCDVTGEVPLLPQSDDGEDSPHNAILLAAGMAKLVSAGDVRYQLQSLDDMATTPSATFIKAKLSANDDEARKYIARGTKLKQLALTLETKKEGFYSFQGEGLFDAHPTSWETAPSVPTAYSGDARAYKLASIALVFDGTTYRIRKIVISTNQDLDPDDSGEDGKGTRRYHHRGRPTNGAAAAGGSFDLEGGSAALLDIYAKYPAGTIGQLVATVSNGTRDVEVLSEYVQLGDPSIGGNLIEKLSVPFRCVRGVNSAGDHDWQVLYKNAA
jgi:hypothetical protein